MVDILVDGITALELILCRIVKIVHLARIAIIISHYITLLVTCNRTISNALLGVILVIAVLINTFVAETIDTSYGIAFLQTCQIDPVPNGVGTVVILVHHSIVQLDYVITAIGEIEIEIERELALLNDFVERHIVLPAVIVHVTYILI